MHASVPHLSRIGDDGLLTSPGDERAPAREYLCRGRGACRTQSGSWTPPVEVEMSNVNLHVTNDISLGVRHLRGRFVPVERSAQPYLDDKLSYTVTIDSAEVALTMASLNALMKRTLGQDRSNVEKLRISIDDEGRLRQLES